MAGLWDDCPRPRCWVTCSLCPPSQDNLPDGFPECRPPAVGSTACVPTAPTASRVSVSTCTIWDRCGEGALWLGVGFPATSNAVPSLRSLHLLSETSLHNFGLFCNWLAFLDLCGSCVLCTFNVLTPCQMFASFHGLFMAFPSVPVVLHTAVLRVGALHPTFNGSCFQDRLQELFPSPRSTDVLQWYPTKVLGHGVCGEARGAL